MRYNRQHLEAKVETINTILGEKTVPWSMNTHNEIKANVGTFVISSYAPGDRHGTRYSLERMVSDGGGVTVVIPTVCGAENFADALTAFTTGLQMGRESKKTRYELEGGLNLKSEPMTTANHLAPSPF